VEGLRFADPWTPVMTIAALPFVIATGAQGSGEICGLPIPGLLL
jgi:hypothetical protein